MEFENKTVLITGASRGIGRGLAAAFGEKRALVIVNYLKSKKQALDVIGQIKEAGGQGIAIRADVSKRRSAERMMKVVFKKYGRIDILINNAGVIFQPAGWQEISERDWERTLAVNLTGVFNCIRAVAPRMLRQKKGKIINISSLAGIYPRGAVFTTYSAAKAGVITLTQAFAKELAPNINVNAVAPGRINVGMARIRTPKEAKAYAKETPLKRIGTVEDVVNAVVFLASEKASFITGQTLILDGGVSLK